MAKDEEIRQLRNEIAVLKDYDKAQTLSTFTETLSYRDGDDDDRSIISKFMGGRSSQSVFSSPEMDAERKDARSLKKINEILRKELEEARKQCNDYKVALEKEKERSENEMQAFAGALKGVDELRTAAESLSREVTRMKEREKENQLNAAYNTIDGENEFNASDAIRKMEKAKRMIDVSTLKSEKQNLWGKVKSSFGLRVLDEGSVQGSVHSSFTPKKKSSSSMRRIKDNDDVSIISSFF